jgi:hypothetical protein
VLCWVVYSYVYLPKSPSLPHCVTTRVIAKLTYTAARSPHPPSPLSAPATPLLKRYREPGAPHFGRGILEHVWRLQRRTRRRYGCWVRYRLCIEPGRHGRAHLGFRKGAVGIEWSGGVVEPYDAGQYCQWRQGHVVVWQFGCANGGSRCRSDRSGCFGRSSGGWQGRREGRECVA